MELKHRKCVPCEGGVDPLSSEQLQEFLPKVPGWRVGDNKIHRTLTFAGFRQALRFVNAMAELAEEEGHHPDFCVHYNRVDVTLWTHAIGGLSENDFILASKIDSLPR